MDPSSLENMTPEQIQQLVALGIIPDQMAGMDKQMEYANQLRSTPTPEMYGNGRVMVAANPMEHIAAGLQRYKGMKDMKELQAQQEALRKDQTAGRSKFFEAWLQAQRGGTPPIAPGVGTPPVQKAPPMAFGPGRQAPY